jgi:hypothetical protein
VAIDKGGQMRGGGLAVHEDIRAFLEVPHPQIRLIRFLRSSLDASDQFEACFM